MQNNAKETNTFKSELIHYYEAIEAILPGARKYGMFRTHFGMLPEKMPSDYCYFRTIFDPLFNINYTEKVHGAMDNLHKQIFDKYSQFPKNVLDVGCGTAGTLKILSEQWPNAQLTGVNINEKQLSVAGEHCIDKNNIKLIQQDILNYFTENKFDLIYFIESAFHIPKKDELVFNLNKLLQTNGEICIVDIFFQERFSKSGNLGNDLFDYRTLNYWKNLFGICQIKSYEYIDISENVANLIMIRTTEKEFLNDIAAPLINEHPDKEMYLTQLKNVYSGYVKLQRLLSLNILNYGILRMRKME